MELLTRQAIKTFTSEGIESSNMTASVEDMDMFTMFLRDKIYTDKTLAPIREYICNANESHILSGVDDAVQVCIQTDENDMTWISVRDYGLGLSDHDVRSVFGMYGKSTKRNTQKLGGCFGVGAMSAFAYCNDYQVISYHNGTKTTYICSLGAGENGVEVGQMYKVAEEPTTDRGIEVSFIINPCDVMEFIRTTKTFVRTFDPTLKLKFTCNLSYSKSVHEPVQPIRRKIIGDLVFNLYNREDFTKEGIYSFWRYGEYAIRMAGVVYKITKYNPSLNRSFAGVVIVDVPIGAMSPQISREAFEETQPNARYIQTIENALNTLWEEDIENAPKYSFKEFVENYAREQILEWFTISTDHLYQDYCDFYRRISYIGIDKKRSIIWKNVPFVYIFPTLKNLKNWHTRLSKHLSTEHGAEYTGYAYITSEDYTRLNLPDDLDCIFLDIKKMKLPKLEKINNGEVKYLVIRDWGRKHYFTSSELEDFVNNNYRQLDWDNLTEEWWKDPELTNTEFCHRVIFKVGNIPSRYRHSGYRANSQKLIDAMVEIGWVTYPSNEWNEAIKLINDRATRKSEESDHHYAVYNHPLRSLLRTSTIKRLQDNRELFKKFDQRFLAIRNEKSLRAKIIRELCPGGQSDLTREELGIVLKLKQ